MEKKWWVYYNHPFEEGDNYVTFPQEQFPRIQDLWGFIVSNGGISSRRVKFIPYTQIVFINDRYV